MCFYTTSTLIRIPLTALSLWKHIQLFPSVIFKPPTLEIPHLTGRLPRHKPVFESGAQGLVLPLLEHIKSREFVTLQPRYPSSKGFSPLHLENTWSLHFSFLCYSHSLCWHTAFDYQTAVILFFFFFLNTFDRGSVRRRLQMHLPQTLCSRMFTSSTLPESEWLKEKLAIAVLTLACPKAD